MGRSGSLRLTVSCRLGSFATELSHILLRDSSGEGRKWRVVGGIPNSIQRGDGVISKIEELLAHASREASEYDQIAKDAAEKAMEFAQAADKLRESKRLLDEAVALIGAPKSQAGVVDITPDPHPLPNQHRIALAVGHVVQALSVPGALRATELAATLGAELSDVQGVLDSLLAAGKVRRTRSGKYIGSGGTIADLVLSRVNEADGDVNPRDIHLMLDEDDATTMRQVGSALNKLAQGGKIKRVTRGWFRRIVPSASDAAGVVAFKGGKSAEDAIDQFIAGNVKPSNGPRKVKTVYGDIAEFLSAPGSYHATDIAKAINGGQSMHYTGITIPEAIRAMVRDGRVIKNRGRYMGAHGITFEDHAVNLVNNHGGPCSANDVKCDGDRNKLRAHMANAAERGRIQKVSRGVYAPKSWRAPARAFAA